MTPKTIICVAARVAGLAAAVIGLSLAATIPVEAVESPPGSDVLEPEGAAELAEEPTVAALDDAIGLPADLADTSGELVAFGADVHPGLTDMRFTVIVDTNPSLAVAGARRDLEADGWTIGGLAGTMGFTATRDLDGVEDGNLDGIGEQSLLVEVDTQVSGATAVHYTVSDTVDPSNSAAAASALFTGIREAQVDPALTFESASLTATMRPYTRTGGFGTVSTPPGVAFTSRYQAPIGEAARLVGLLDDICSWDGYRCTGDPSLPAADQGSVSVRMPAGGEGLLSISPLPDEGIAVVQFALTLWLDTATILEPGDDATRTLPSNPGGDNEPGTIPPKVGEEPRPEVELDPLTRAPSPQVPLALVGGVGVLVVSCAALGTRVLCRRRRTSTPTPENHPATTPAPGPAPITELADGALAAGAAARPRLVQVDEQRVEVLMSEPATPPAGWTTAADLVWCRQASEPSSSDTPAITPMLVPLDQDRAGTRLLLDLEAEAAIELQGDPDGVTSFIDDVLHSAASSDIEVHVLAEDPDSPPAGARPDQPRPAPQTWRELVDRTALTKEALDHHDWPSVFAGRAANPDHPALRPAIVITDLAPPPEITATLADPHWGATTILSVAPIGGTPLCFTDAEVHLPTLGIVLDRRTTTNPVDGARSAGEDVEVIEPADPPQPLHAAAVAPMRDATVVIHLLGDIRVEGGQPLTARQAAVLAYIATHPGATAARVADAVWTTATRSSRRKTLANTVSEIRTAIGKALLPDATNSRYRTGPGLVTDIDVFDHLVRRARDHEGAERAELLRAALELVEGPPFTYPAGVADSYLWIDIENQVATWESRIRLVARQCVDLYIDLGDPAEAVQVANAALAALPTDVGVTELLMRAHAANGDLRAIRRVYEAHGRSLNAQDLDTVHTTTAELFDLLMSASDDLTRSATPRRWRRGPP